MTDSFKISKFSPQGLKEFDILVSDPERKSNFSGLVTPICKIEIEKKIFATKMEFAEYIDSKLNEMIDLVPRLKSRLNDPEMWAWLSYYYWDQVAPETNGSRNIGEAYRHVPSDDYRYSIRHLLRGPWLLYRRYKQNSRVFLCNPLHQLGDFTEQIASRREIAICAPIIEALNKIYYDDERQMYKIGASSSGKPGTLRRFIRVIQQLSVNYDFHTMSSEDIVDLLPFEFNRFKDEI